VNFYWSNPATGVLRSSSTFVGTAFVDLNPGETKEVLCVIPWVPVIVNDGHECLVAEVVHPSDPLPSPLPDEFDPPTHHQIAQKNVTVLVMKEMMMVMPIQIETPRRAERLLLLTTETGGTLDKQNLIQAGLENYRADERDSLKVGLSLEPGCGESGKQGLDREIRIPLKPGAARAVYLRVWPPKLEPRTYALLRVIARDEQRVVGGMTYIVVNRVEV
jgi:hypothetical protein